MTCNGCGDNNFEERKDLANVNDGEGKTVIVCDEKSETKTDKVLFFVKNGLILFSALLAFIGLFVSGTRLGKDEWFFLTSYKDLVACTGKTILLVVFILSAVGSFALMLTSAILFAKKKKDISAYAYSAVLISLVGTASYMSLETFGVLARAMEAMIILSFIMLGASIALSCVSAYRKDKKGLCLEIMKGLVTAVLAVSVISFGLPAVDEMKIGIFAVCREMSSWSTILIAICFLAGLFITAVSGIMKAFLKDKTSVALACVGLFLQIAVYGGVVALCYGAKIIPDYIIGMAVSLIGCILNIVHISLKRKTNKQAI